MDRKESTRTLRDALDASPQYAYGLAVGPTHSKAIRCRGGGPRESNGDDMENESSFSGLQWRNQTVDSRSWPGLESSPDDEQRTGLPSVAVDYRSFSSVVLVEPGFASGRKQQRKYDFCTRHLTYKVQVKEIGSVVQKVILNGVNAEARHGEVFGIFGPSGSGKTTFLDALAGRIQRQCLEGDILVNGAPMKRKFRKLSGYVMQDDALYPLLTVRETLMFSARLRMSAETSTQEKLERVKYVIKQLGLSVCVDTPVGDEQVRGISGGERRRVSIGVELVNDPRVLFLDEPTTGLDSSSALQLMEHLCRMVRETGQTVLVTLHQPSFSQMEFIHNTLVLVQGNVVFHGHHQSMVDYFSALGYRTPKTMTVVEYMLDIIEKKTSTPNGLIQLLAHHATHKVASSPLVLHSDGSDTGTGSDATGNREKDFVGYPISFLSQSMILAHRTWINTFRSKDIFLARIGMLILAGLAISSVFFHARISQHGLHERVSFIIYGLSMLVFTSGQALPLFLQEREIVIRDAARGAYRTSAFVFAGTVVILPFLFVLALVYTAATYWMVGFYTSVNAISMYVLTIFLTLAVANSFVTFIAGVATGLELGQDLISAILALYFLFAGYFIKSGAIPKYWIWMEYISVFKYPFASLVENELKHRKGVVWYDNVTSADALRNLSLGSANPCSNFIVMATFFVGYRLLFYITLRCKTQLRK